MTAKDEFLLSVQHDYSHADNANRYSNLSLNQNNKCSIVSPIQSYSKSANDKNFGKQIVAISISGDINFMFAYRKTWKKLRYKYVSIGLQQHLKIPDSYSTVSDYCEKIVKPQPQKKSLDLCLNSLTLNDEIEEESKKRWKKYNSSNAYCSTLSLHISAYENSVLTANDSNSSESLGNEISDMNKKSDKQFFNASVFKNPFEFPRQQENVEATTPEVAQFRASQTFYNPNKIRMMESMNSQNRIPIRSVAYRSAATGAIRPISHPGSRIFTVRPASGSVVHRLSAARQPDVIDLEAEQHGQISRHPVRQYANYSINGEGISRVRYAVPAMNRRPIYARPAVRPTYYRTYPGVPQSIGRHRIIPYIPRYPNFRRYDYDPTEEDIDHAIQMEESKMQQEENSYFYTDPDFQRIEANIVKKENMARQQLEKQRLATLTSYTSRSSDINVVQNRQVQQAVQKLMSARSELTLKTNDSAFDTDIKMTLKGVIDQVCQQDREEGWHKKILQKIRRVPEVPFLHSQPTAKRSVQKHSEVMLNERSEFFKREILKRRARLELEVELDYGFVKQTRTGTIACLPCSQIYARIGRFWFF